MAKVITISAQRFLDDEIVAAKLAARDFTAAVSPAFEIDGQIYRVLLDGHHSIEAAKQAGTTPEIVEQDVRDNDSIAMLSDGRIEDFLETHRIDSDYYDIETGKDVW